MALDPHVRQTDHFIECCGIDSPHNGTIDYSLTTKKGQGFIHYENGDLDVVADKTSKEVVGRKITNEQEPAKIIRAENGGILLEAPNGTITIKAANIRFVAVDGGDGGEITFQSSKLIHQDAPTITNQGTNISNMASQSVSITGTYTDTHAQTENTQSSGTEEDKSSFLAQILNAIKKFQKFYKSLCSD